MTFNPDAPDAHSCDVDTQGPQGPIPSVTGTRDTTLFGVPIRQSWRDLYLWELFFAKYNHDFKHFIELGSGNGGMSTFFLLQCIQYRKSFTTVDILDLNYDKPLSAVVGLKNHFSKLDIFANPNWIKEKLKSPCVLYCDDGDKKREAQLFSKFLVTGDFFAVHDFGTEIMSADIPVGMQHLDLGSAELMSDTMTGFFRKG